MDSRLIPQMCGKKFCSFAVKGLEYFLKWRVEHFLDEPAPAPTSREIANRTGRYMAAVASKTGVPARKRRCGLKARV